MSTDNATPRDVDLPSSEEDVAAAVRAAAASGHAIEAIGSGTKRHHGPAGTVPVKMLSLARLGRITAYEPGDLVVTAQAGVRLSDLQRTLADHGQWLPLDPPYAAATVGGVLATNSSGPRRLGYGTAKDLLLGLRVCSHAGTLTKSGGRVVKNVTGYDLHKLHVGAFGSLGVLLEATFKVRPRPETSAIFAYACPDLTTAHRLLLEVGASALRPVALEALDAGAAGPWRAAAADLQLGAGATDAVAVVGFEGSSLAFERHRRDLERLAAGASASTVLDGTAAAAAWAAFRDLPRHFKDLVTVRVGARPRELADLLPALVRSTVAAGINVHAGSGIGRIYLDAKNDGAAVARVVGEWHTAVAAKGGYAVVEAAPRALPGRERLPWGASATALGQSLKAAWDPNNLINPGRMSL